MSQDIPNLTGEHDICPSELPIPSQETAEPHATLETGPCLSTPEATGSLTSCVSLPCDQSSNIPRENPCQFTPLDQLSTSKKTFALEDEWGEGTLKIGMGQDHDKNHQDFLQCIKATSLPSRVIVRVGKLAKDYDQAYRSLLPSEIHKVKCIYFANLLIAAFEIKELSEDELKESREIEVFKMEEKELVSMVTKITEGFFKHLNQHSQDNEQRWAKIAECFKQETAPFFRKTILIAPDHGFESIFFTIPHQTQEPIASTACEETKKHECDESENNPDCNNLSMQTQGHVTDLEISLSLCHNESVDDITSPPQETEKHEDEAETVGAFESA